MNRVQCQHVRCCALQVATLSSVEVGVEQKRLQLSLVWQHSGDVTACGADALDNPASDSGALWGQATVRRRFSSRRAVLCVVSSCEQCGCMKGVCRVMCAPLKGRRRRSSHHSKAEDSGTATAANIKIRTTATNMSHRTTLHPALACSLNLPFLRLSIAPSLLRNYFICLNTVDG